MFKYLILLILCELKMLEVDGARWTVEQANQWYNANPLYIGSNYIPATSVNVIEMWQTFDTATIEKEFQWASDINMNIMRVFLHVLFYENNAQDYYKKMDEFLNIADRYNIKIMFVLFDECWLAEPKLGSQPAPIPGLHNSQWVRCPGQPYLLDQNKWPLLKQYTTDILTRFSNDSRVVIWDLYNEPECSQQIPTVLPLLREIYSAALIANPRQPLTVGILPGLLNASLPQFEIEASDIITFHSYEPLSQTMDMVNDLRKLNRPLICTEYMGRTIGSTFHTHTFYFIKESIGAINWGLVAGKTQTYYQWRSPENAPIPLVWFHDIFNQSGQPYSSYEIQFFKDLKSQASQLFFLKQFFIITLILILIF